MSIKWSNMKHYVGMSSHLKGESLLGRISSREERNLGTMMLMPWRSLRSRSAELRMIRVSICP